jgi:hypothetical protein
MNKRTKTWVEQMELRRTTPRAIEMMEVFA